MAKTKTKKKESFTTPLGVAYYPNLHIARQFRKKGKPMGKYFYDTGLVLERDDPDTIALLAVIQQQMELAQTENGSEEFANPPTRPYVLKDEDGNEEEDETRIVVNFKVEAQVPCKDGSIWDKTPGFFDGAGNPIIGGPVPVGGGSRIGVTFTVYRWENADGQAGVRLEPSHIQVVDLVEWTEFKASASDVGFSTHEGSFSAASFVPAVPQAGVDDELSPENEDQREAQQGASVQTGADF